MCERGVSIQCERDRGTLITKANFGGRHDSFHAACHFEVSLHVGLPSGRDVEARRPKPTPGPAALASAPATSGILCRFAKLVLSAARAKIRQNPGKIWKKRMSESKNRDFSLVTLQKIHKIFQKSGR